jgi:hypothetical protein
VLFSPLLASPPLETAALTVAEGSTVAVLHNASADFYTGLVAKDGNFDDPAIDDFVPWQAPPRLMSRRR